MKPKVKTTVYPNKQPSINEWFKYIHKETVKSKGFKNLKTK